MNVYLQNTFSFIDVSFIPRLTSSLVARQTSVFPWSCLVGVKFNVDKLTLPSDETCRMEKKEQDEPKPFIQSNIYIEVDDTARTFAQ